MEGPVRGHGLQGQGSWAPSICAGFIEEMKASGFVANELKKFGQHDHGRAAASDFVLVFGEVSCRPIFPKALRA